MKKDRFLESVTRLNYNYLIANGWVIVLLGNRPVNFMADCGCPECISEYYSIDPVFSALCEEYKDTSVSEIIEYVIDGRRKFRLK